MLFSRVTHTYIVVYKYLTWTLFLFYFIKLQTYTLFLNLTTTIRNTEYCIAIDIQHFDIFVQVEISKV